MNDETHRLLRDGDDQTPPPTDLTVETLLSGGRRRLRRRRVSMASAGLAAVAAFAVAVAIVPGAFAGQDEDAADGEKYALPELDSRKGYSFEDLSEPTTNETTRAYQEAFWGYLEEEFEGVRNYGIVDEEFEDLSDLNPGDPMLGDEVSGATLERTVAGLAEWRYSNKDKSSAEFDKNTGFKRPYYQFNGTAANNLPDYTQFPDRKYADGLSIRVLPAGSFVAEFSGDGGMEGQYIMDCRDEEENSDVSCDERTTSRGEKILSERASQLVEVDGEKVPYSQTNTLALVRDDGVGIVVTDEAPINRYEGESSDGEPTTLEDPDDSTPALDLAELTELARALPNRPVE